jgi:MarR family transcriptional regulator, transcriptional regulator for hemolysin
VSKSSGPAQRERHSRTRSETDVAKPHQPQPDTRKRAIGLKLTVIARQLGKRFDQAVERDGLTRAKWSAVVAIARNPGATQRSIAAMLEITEVTAGQLIDRLCADGYLERREHPTDRRAYCLHLTPAAQPLLERLGEIAKSHEEDAFAGFSEEDLERLDTLLGMIAANIAACRTRSEDKVAAAIVSEAD